MSTSNVKPPGWLLPADPFPVQAEAFRRATDRKRYGFFMEMGLGKTYVAMADHTRDVFLDKSVGHAIIVPVYLKSSWRDEWEQWKVPYPLATWPDVPPVGHKFYKEPHGIVYNYQSIVYSGGEHLEGLLKSSTPYTLTLDESRAIGRPSGSWSTKAMYLRTLADKLRAMCGQPLTNSPLELFPQLRWCGALEGWNSFAFKNRFCKTGGFKGKQVIGVRDERIEELHEIIDGCSFRALKADWFEGMPPKLWPSPLEFEMNDAKQVQMYREMQSELAALIPDRPEDDEEYVLAKHVGNAYQKLQQISRGFIIDNEGRVIQLVTPGKNQAIKTLIDAIEGCIGKVLVFAFHRYSMDVLAQALSSHNFVVMKGGMKDTEIEQVKRRFNQDNDVKGMILQLEVGARGHTLLGTPDIPCSTTIYYESIWDADAMWQSQDRNHRFGQKLPVTYLTLSCSSIDKKIARSLADKTSMVGAILDAIRSKPRGSTEL